jgi:hypothetical protein
MVSTRARILPSAKPPIIGFRNHSDGLTGIRVRRKTCDGERGAAVADIDNDGRLDLIVSALGETPKLLRNISESGGRWITLRLVGRASNRDGLGTIVRVTLDDGRVLVNHATTSVGFASSSDPRVHVGLGRAAHVKQIELLWPSGVHQTIARPPLDAVLTIEERAVGKRQDQRVASTSSVRRRVCIDRVHRKQVLYAPWTCWAAQGMFSRPLHVLTRPSTDCGQITSTGERRVVSRPSAEDYLCRPAPASVSPRARDRLRHRQTDGRRTPAPTASKTPATPFRGPP